MRTSQKFVFGEEGQETWPDPVNILAKAALQLAYVDASIERKVQMLVVAETVMDLGKPLRCV